jgi:diacylglycerol kinase family enzyme
MRRRLPTGTHLPHPRIAATTGRSVEITGPTDGLPVTLDGRTAGRAERLTAAVRHPALRLLL